MLLRTRVSRVVRPTTLSRQLPIQRRELFGLFRSKQASPPPPSTSNQNQPIIAQDDLFHVFSRSPVPAIRKRGEIVKSLAPCPVCLDVHEERRPVQFECPNCGWPTHATEIHWKEDHEHDKYCSRLREANEDEHDLRSGRELVEFELPGEHYT